MTLLWFGDIGCTPLESGNQSKGIQRMWPLWKCGCRPVQTFYTITRQGSGASLGPRIEPINSVCRCFLAYQLDIGQESCQDCYVHAPPTAQSQAFAWRVPPQRIGKRQLRRGLACCCATACIPCNGCQAPCVHKVELAAQVKSFTWRCIKHARNR